MMSLWVLTSANHPDVFVGLDVLLNQTLHVRALRERLRSFCTARDNQEVEIVLSGNLTQQGHKQVW